MIKLTFKHYDGKTEYAVNADPTWYADDLRDKLEEQEGLSSDLLQRLVFDGDDLDDAETLEEMGIEEGSTILIEKVSVTVVLPTKKVFRIKLAPDDPHPSKKIKKAALKKDTSLVLESLICRFDGQELTDGTSMGDLQLGHEDTVVCDLYAVQVTFQGDAWSINVNPKDTIAALKETIQSKTNIGPKKQKYKWNDRPVHEILSLRDQSIPHNAVLELVEPEDDQPKKKEKFTLSVPAVTPKAFEQDKIRITILKSWDTNQMYVIEDFDTSQYLDDLRDQLLKIHGIPKNQTQVISHDDTEIDETESFADQDIADGEDNITLKLEPIKVSIDVAGKKPFKVAVAPGQASVKRIKKIVAKKCGIELGSSIVSLNGKELVNMQDDLLDAGLEHLGTLNVEAYTITVEKWDGEVYETAISPSDCVSDVKVALKEIHGLTDVGKILKAGEETPLNEFLSLKDQGVVHRGRITLAEPEKKKVVREKFKLDISLGTTAPIGVGPTPVRPGKASSTGDISVSIKHWNGDLLEVSLDAGDYVQDLIDKIEAEHGIPADLQRLSLDGTIIDGVDSIKEVGIVNGSELVLEAMKLQIVLPNGKSVRIPVKPEDSVKRLKKIIAKKQKFEASRLCLFAGGLLDDDKFLKDYSISHGDKVTVELFKISIAHWTGDTFVLDDLSPDDTLNDIRVVIMNRMKIPKKDQNFEFNGTKLNDFLSLKSQNVLHRSTLIMQDPMPNGLFSPKSPKPTISHLKDLVADDLCLSSDEDNNDDDDDASVDSVASWIKEKALSESFTGELCTVEASEESWLGIAAAKEKENNKPKKAATKKKKPLLGLPEL